LQKKVAFPVVDPRTCADGIAPGGSCTFTVTYTPTEVGRREAIVTVARADGGLLATTTEAGVGVGSATPRP